MIKDVLHVASYCTVAIGFLFWVGNIACKRLLDATGLTATFATPPTASRAGRVIGILERTLIAAGVLASSWEILAAVIALKTVARFKEIDDQAHAEYFLVGSLFSVAWAVVIAKAWLLYDQHVGLNVSEWLFRSAEVAKPLVS